MKTFPPHIDLGKCISFILEVVLWSVKRGLWSIADTLSSLMSK